jgi:hypothetical protein
MLVETPTGNPLPDAPQTHGVAGDSVAATNSKPLNKMASN